MSREYFIAPGPSVRCPVGFNILMSKFLALIPDVI